MSQAARTLTCLVLLCGLGWQTAEAQGAPKRAPTRRLVEATVAAVIAGPLAVGAADANLTRPDGSPLTEFRTDTQYGLGAGAEASVAVFLSTRFAVEIAGAWVRQDLETEITDDFERAPGLTLTQPINRFELDGAVVVMLRHSRRTEVFLRGGAGWMQEVTDGATLAETGTTGTAGLGLKYWFRDPPIGRGTRIGLRLDARVLARSGGVTVQSDTLRVGPSGIAGLVFGF